MASNSAPPSPSLINAAFQSLFPSASNDVFSPAAVGADASSGFGISNLAAIVYSDFSMQNQSVSGYRGIGSGEITAFSRSTVGGGGVVSGGVLAINSSNLVQVYHSSLVPAVSVDGKSAQRKKLNHVLVVSTTCLAPEFDHDFTRTNDKGNAFRRGNQPYERPCGSYRVALKVKDKFGLDNTWLGMKGDDPNEWPVSYHGTGEKNAQDIAQDGFKLIKGKRFLYGKGIYSTPELEVAKAYATRFEHQGTSYMCVLQNRVNPKYLKVFSKSETGVGIYWLSAADEEVDESELIRPYGLCLFKISPGCSLW